MPETQTDKSNQSDPIPPAGNACQEQRWQYRGRGARFLHLGRFAQSYRQQYGELPSDTLKRRR